MKSIDARFYIHKINPLSLLSTTVYAGHSSIRSSAIRRCRELAEQAKGQEWVGFYRVVDTDIREVGKSPVIFLSHVVFDTVTHWDLEREKAEVV
jgi:hypothetical protein